MMTCEDSRGASALKVGERPVGEIVRLNALGVIMRNPVHPLSSEVDG